MEKRPKLAALAVVCREDKVLLVRRRHEPDANFWGFPGGHVDYGESVGAAASRELLEETTIHAEPTRTLIGLDTIVPDDDGGTAFHFYMVAVECSYVSGEPRGREDVFEAAWVSCQDVLERRIRLSEDVDTVLRRALEQCA